MLSADWLKIMSS